MKPTALSVPEWVSTGTPRPIRVAVVDDEPMAREVLKLILDRTPGFLWAAPYENGVKALAGLASDPVDMVLMDLRMPGMSGLECLRALVRRQPSLCAVVVTGSTDIGLMPGAFAVGARGYLLKPFTPTECVSSLRAAWAGEVVLQRCLFSAMLRFCPAHDPIRPDAAPLSPDELNLLSCLAKGLEYKEISDVLGWSAAKTKRRMVRIYHRLGVHNRTEATARYHAIAQRVPPVGD
jgi:DNA-binding NarL/FixJ family response regulator